jgi:hypothetical protein
MTSEAKARASRANGQRSQGPTTITGKAIASQNALQHGLLSRRVLLPGEDPDEYVTFCEAFRREWDPRGAAELFCVEQLISAAWRLRRIARIEAGLMRTQMFTERLPRVPPAPGLRDIPREVEARLLWAVPAAAQYRDEHDRQAYRRAVVERDRALRRATQRRARRENDLGRAFGVVEAGDGIAKLLRYQTKLERSFRRFWVMLVELQATRQHRHPRLNPILDVTAATDPTEAVDGSHGEGPSSSEICQTNPPIADKTGDEAEKT